MLEFCVLSSFVILAQIHLCVFHLHLFNHECRSWRYGDGIETR